AVKSNGLSRRSYTWSRMMTIGRPSLTWLVNLIFCFPYYSYTIFKCFSLNTSHLTIQLFIAKKWKNWKTNWNRSTSRWTLSNARKDGEYLQKTDITCQTGLACNV